MAGPLNSIFAAVDTQITANLAGTSAAGPTFGIVPEDRIQEASNPRVCWVPTDEDIGPPVGQGGDITVDGVGNQTIAANQPIATRTITVECDVWGPDRDTVDLLMINAVFSAVQDTLTRGSYGVLRAKWLLPEESVTKNGETYRIFFQFMVPVVKVTPQTTVATITSIPMTPQIQPIVGS